MKVKAPAHDLYRSKLTEAILETGRTYVQRPDIALMDRQDALRAARKQWKQFRSMPNGKILMDAWIVQEWRKSIGGYRDGLDIAYMYFGMTREDETR